MRDQYLNMRVEAETKRRLDELRRIEKDLPGQTAMVERLIDRAYAEQRAYAEVQPRQGT